MDFILIEYDDRFFSLVFYAGVVHAHASNILFIASSKPHLSHCPLVLRFEAKHSLSLGSENCS